MKALYEEKNISIFNCDCFDLMESMIDNKEKIDIVLTSPFYNTNKKAGKNKTNQNTKCNEYHYIRYDTHVDNMTNEEYCDFTEKLFNKYDMILKDNGCILYNISYGSENTEGMFLAINSIITKTNFTIADCIIWKKKTAFPNSCSPNKLTRITEFVFVFCRKDELLTFKTNKKCTSIRKTGQKAYENIYNFIEAKNNDGSNPLNKATFSTELVEKLLKLYANENTIIYDSFIGTGTTAVACKKLGLKCIGSELSEAQCKYAVERLNQ